MADTTELINVFEDTSKWYSTDPILKGYVKKSISGTKFYSAEVYPDFEMKTGEKTIVTVSKDRTFAAAMKLRKENPDARIAVHNFASATNPGGGVTRGSRAQEECLCRCSTLYHTLNVRELWDKFYGFHRSLHNVCYTDACIYTPDIYIIKTDTDLPKRMPESDWCKVDVLTCAAPNLREKPNNSMNPGSAKPIKLKDTELYELHFKRAKHMLTIAASNGVEILVLGAFGCGAFCNNPAVVAAAYRDVLKEFDGCFKKIEFAVYCSPRDTANYDKFNKVFGKIK